MSAGQVDPNWMRGAALGGAVAEILLILDVVVSRPSLPRLSDWGVFVLATFATLVAVGLSIGLVSGLAWRWLKSPRIAAFVAAGLSYPLGRSLFSGAFISQSVSPWLGGALVASTCAIGTWVFAKRARPHWAWLGVGVALYAVDAFVWRPLYPAAHLLLAAGYVVTLALGLADVIKRLKLGINPAMLLVGDLSASVLAAVLTIVFLPSRQAARFALHERTNAARKIVAVLPRPSDSRARPKFLAEAPDLSKKSEVAAIPVLPGANVVLVTIDAMRADLLGRRVDGRSLTPALDRIAEHAVTFERAYAQAPHSAFSLASLMTSDYVYTTLRIRDRRLPFLAERLKLRGYQTAAIYTEGVFFTGKEALDAYARSKFGFETTDTGDRSAEETTGAALEALRSAAQAKKPLFLWLHYFDPHEPYRRHAEFDYGADGRGRYLSEVAYVDQQIGRLVAGLEQFDRSTILILTADHGEEFGEHGGVYHGSTVYDEQIRVPLLVAVPGLSPRRVSEPVELVDLPPTILRLLGFEPPVEMLGDDLGSALIGKPVDRPVYAEVDTKKMVVSGGHKLIDDWRRGTKELYDLAADPEERLNRYDLDAERATSLEAALSAWLDRLERAVESESQDMPDAIELGRMGDLRSVASLGRLLLDEGAKIEHRLEAARLLGRLQDKSALPHLWKAVRQDASVKAEAAIAIGELYDKKGRDILARVVRHEDPNVAARAGIALAKLADARAEPALIRGLTLDEHEVRLRSARYLRVVGSRDAIAPLLEAADDLRFRALVVLTLAHIARRSPDPRVRPYIVDQMKTSSSEHVRNYAAASLGYLRDLAAVPDLIERMKAGDLSFAVESLIRLGALDRGTMRGVDFTEGLERRNKALTRCHRRETEVVENYRGAGWCEARREVGLEIEGAKQGRLLVRARPGGQAVGKQARLDFNGRNVGSFPLRGGWQEHLFELEETDWRKGSNALRLVVDVEGEGAVWDLDHVVVVPE